MNVKPLVFAKDGFIHPKPPCKFKRGDSVALIHDKLPNTESVKNYIVYKNGRYSRTETGRIYDLPPRGKGTVKEVVVNHHTKKVTIHVAFGSYLYSFVPDWLEFA
jgi:hypothetical protein